MIPDPILDDLFHGIIWSAFITEARAAGTWPDPEKVRQRAYATFEAEKRATPPARSP
jgi:hypothetical protein